MSFTSPSIRKDKYLKQHLKELKDDFEAQIEYIENAMSDGFIVIADVTGGEFCSPHVTGCALTQL